MKKLENVRKASLLGYFFAGVVFFSSSTILSEEPAGQAATTTTRMMSKVAENAVISEIMDASKIVFDCYKKVLKRTSGALALGLGTYLGYSLLKDLASLTAGVVLLVKKSRENAELTQEELDTIAERDSGQTTSSSAADQQDKNPSCDTTVIAGGLAKLLLINPITKFFAKSVLCLILCRRGFNLLKTGTLSAIS